MVRRREWVAVDADLFNRGCRRQARSRYSVDRDVQHVRKASAYLFKYASQPLLITRQPFYGPSAQHDRVRVRACFKAQAFSVSLDIDFSFERLNLEHDLELAGIRGFHRYLASITVEAFRFDCDAVPPCRQVIENETAFLISIFDSNFILFIISQQHI